MIEISDYSGHIRNWRRLCEELNINVSLKREEREAEIIKKAYIEWGKEMGNHLHGMFAFSIFDEENETVFCLRDHF